MKRRIYLELGITLLVGFLIGFFVNSLVTNKRINDFSAHKGEVMFWRHALTEVGATEEQKQIIYPIIKDYSDETREILQESWKQLPLIWKEMEKEIMLELTPEQQKQIKVIKEEHKAHGPNEVKGKGNQKHKDGRMNKQEERPRRGQGEGQGEGQAPRQER